jgi:hypothetical protein
MNTRREPAAETEALMEQVRVELTKADEGKGSEPWAVRALYDALVREQERSKVYAATIADFQERVERARVKLLEALRAPSL